MSPIFKIGLKGYPEMSVINNHSTLLKPPKERRSQSHHGGSVKLRVIAFYCETHRKTGNKTCAHNAKHFFSKDNMVLDEVTT